MKTQPRREVVKHPVPPKKAKKYIASETAQTSPPLGIPLLENQGQHPRFPTEHHYSLLTEREKCGSCVYKDILIQKYQKRVFSSRIKQETLHKENSVYMEANQK